jgi:glycosyltransferase involved in cell wall biosynthesis
VVTLPPSTSSSVGIANDKLRLLLLSSRYATGNAGKWLPQELAEELCERGHRVDVLVIDPTGRVPSGELVSDVPGLRAFQVPGMERALLARSSAVKYLPQAARLRLDPRVRRFLARRYDGCIFTTPGVIAAGLPGWLRRSGRARTLVMVMWDFFPVANTEIGAIPKGWLSRMLFTLEQRIVRSADWLAVMTPRGETFLDGYYSNVTSRRVVIPPWGHDLEAGRIRLEKRPRFTVVWGGQIVKGRALDDLLHVAAAPEIVAADVQFLIAGDGPGRPGYQDLASQLGATNVEFLGQLSRDQYVALLGTCHLGASFMSEMPVPSFPSKVVDYCRVGLPVLAAVESGTDFGEILEAAGAGIAVPAGNRGELARAIVGLASPGGRDRVASMSAASRQLFEEQLDVRVAADRVEEILR